MTWCDDCNRCVEELCTSCIDKVGLALVTLVALLTSFAALTLLGLICSQVFKRCFALRRRPLGWSRIVTMGVLIAAGAAEVVGCVFPLYERQPERVFRIVVASNQASGEANHSFNSSLLSTPQSDSSDVSASRDGAPAAYADHLYSMLAPCDPNGVGIGLWITGGRMELTERYLGSCPAGDHNYPRRIRTFQAIATIAVALTFGACIALFALDDLAPACVFAATALFLQMVLFGLLEGFFTMSNFCSSSYALHQLGFERGVGWMATAVAAVLQSVSGAALFVAEEATMRRQHASRSTQAGPGVVIATTAAAAVAVAAVVAAPVAAVISRSPTPAATEAERIMVRRRSVAAAAYDGSVRG